MTVWPEMARSAFDGSHGLPVSASMPMTSLPPGYRCLGRSGRRACASRGCRGGAALRRRSCRRCSRCRRCRKQRRRGPKPGLLLPAASPCGAWSLSVVARNLPPLEREPPRPRSFIGTVSCDLFRPSGPPPRRPFAGCDPRHMYRQAEPRTAVATVSMRAHCSPVNARRRASRARRPPWIACCYCLIQTDWMLNTPAMPLQRHTLSPDGSGEVLDALDVRRVGKAPQVVVAPDVVALGRRTPC